VSLWTYSALRSTARCPIWRSHTVRRSSDASRPWASSSTFYALDALLSEQSSDAPEPESPPDAAAGSPAPTDRNEAAEMRRKAARIVRSAGNRSGRGLLPDRVDRRARVRRDTDRSQRETVKSCERRVKPGVKRRESAVMPDDADGGAGLTLAALAAAKRLPEGFLRDLGLRDAKHHRERAVAIPYADEAGNEVAIRYRLALDGGRRFAWRRGSHALPFGVAEPIRALVEAVRLLRDRGVDPVSYSAVARQLGLHPEQIKRTANQAIRAGWLVNETEAKGRVANLALGEPLPVRAGLPTPAEIAALHSLHSVSHDFTLSHADRHLIAHNTIDAIDTARDDAAAIVLAGDDEWTF
jgi:transposase-like protein